MSMFVGQYSCWFWTMVQAVGVITTLIMIYRQVRIARHASMLDALIELEAKWTTPRLETARIMVCRHYLDPTAKGVKATDHYENAVLMFFEHLGLLYSLGILDGLVVWERLSYVAMHYWQILEPKITEMRAADHDDTFYDKFDELNRAMKAIHAKKTKRTALKTDAALSQFAQEEIATLTVKLSDSVTYGNESVRRTAEMGAIEDTSSNTVPPNS